MAAFSYNRYSGDSYENQYRKYLQNQNYVSQIDNAIRETGEMNATVVAMQSREVQDAIHVSSQRQREAIIQLSDGICSTLENGFYELNNNLGDLKDGINGLSNLVGHGFSLIVEGQKITHQYLGQIQNLLRIPDSQKQRVYHIDEGMKYLQNAFRQNPESDFYTDALEEFQAALEKEKKDFFSLYHIGFIYLKSTKHLDPKIAEIFFRNSARYYLAEALVGGTNISNNLLQTHKGFLREAAEAFLFGAEACYLQEKFSAAVELAAEAWKTFPNMTKAGLMQAKYLAANQQVAEAVKILEKAIRINRFLSMEVLPDLDLNSKPEILNLVEKLRIEAVQEAKAKYELCIKVILPNSIATSHLTSIAKLIEVETFLEAKEAIDLLLVEKKWTISSGANISSQGQVIAKISAQEFTGSVIDFVKFERERILALPKANNLIRIEEIEKQKKQLDDEFEGQKNVIEKDIGNLQSQIDNNNAELSKKWKPWISSFAIVSVASLIGISIGNANGFIEVLVVLICGLLMYVGGPVVAIWLIIMIFSSMSTATKNSTLNSSISSNQTNISRLNNELKTKISQLNNDIKKLQ
jgi:tetratricopeptide (TPR) repeat protein